MPVTMHFSTFLKFLTLSDGDRLRELEAYSEPGGFDFYRPLREASTAHLADGHSVDRCRTSIQNRTNDRNRGHNLEAFEGVASFGSRQRPILERPVKSIWRSPRRIFNVHIEPEFLILRQGLRTAVAVYPRGQSALNRDTAGAGIVLLRNAYRGEVDGFGILDVMAGNAYWTPTNVSERVLQSMVGFIELHLSELAR
jgi:hypothetical protein